MEYDVDGGGDSKNVKPDPDSEAFTPVDRRKCERLLLRVYCNELSTDFQEPVTPSSMPEYSEIIKTPMDLSKVRIKLEGRESGSYRRTEDFVADMRLIFKNCATFHKEDSEMSSVGANLESYFEEQLKLLYPDRTFPNVKAEVAAAEPEATPTAPPPKDAGEPETASPKTTCAETPVAQEPLEPPKESPPKEEPQSEGPVEKPESSEKPEESCSPVHTTKEQKDSNNQQEG